jgi:hypothetical protein
MPGSTAVPSPSPQIPQTMTNRCPARLLASGAQELKAPAAALASSVRFCRDIFLRA